MKTISLRKYYYPVCQKEVLVELPDEVADAIAEAPAQRTAMTQSSIITVILWTPPPA